MSTINSLNLDSNGVVTYNNTTGVFTGSALTQHDVLIGAASNGITSVTPSTAGFVLTSNGTTSDPSFKAVSASGAITTIDGDTGSMTPTSGVVTISGGSTGLTTSASASTMDLTGTLTAGHGGTGLSSLTTYELIASGTTATGNFQQISNSTAGYVLTSAGAGALPSFLPAPTGLTWIVDTNATDTLAPSKGYFAAYVGTAVYTLDPTPTVGETVSVVATAAGQLWQIVENTGDTIIFGSSTTTATTGSLTATAQGDSVTLVCYIANVLGNTWIVTPGSVGNITIV